MKYTATVECKTSTMTRTDTFDQCQAWVAWQHELGIMVSARIEPAATVAPLLARLW